MNPPEGAAEEGGAADSDVDAFFRTGKPGRARGPWVGRWRGRGVSDKFGEGGLWPGRACWGAVPLVVEAGVAEILVVMAMLVAFWRGVGAGSSAPLGVHPTCGSL